VAVNLNYTVSSNVMNSCIAQCGIRHVLSSRKFLNKLNLQLDAEIVCLEDFQSKVALGDKVAAGLQAYAAPACLLERWLGLHRVRGDDLLTVIFTSGSTGDPKGVMLTHANVAANVEAVEQVIRLSSRDVLVGVLPFFHSFGYTITLWTVLAIDIKGIYHFSPLDGRQVGKLCQEHGGTALVATPTFLRNYLRRCDKEMFASLDVVVAGAEKLPVELCDAFEEKFGVRPVEGYGTTELAPLVSVNVPPSRSPRDGEADCKEGTVGRPTPGVSAKVVHLETGEELGPGQAGMLWITGSNVMQGYLGRPDLTAEVIRDGWYVTGDVGRLDEQGFIQITGRESRFSKIGGEMVPHIQIEEALSRIIGAGEDESPKVAVTAVPDAKKGERLVVVHTSMTHTPESLTKALGDQGLPNIYIPAVDSYCLVEKLPLLGSGKLDLKAIRAVALEKFSANR
jgi:acyl-[acyl-carrier-protein]-phospholipid O-acyltransferase/long-chain-fatty-acid--[acyl-carrier-protein] ligase